jgi:bifunctional DNA-binding transcriptional regulator/antitoxin component of YhaV-PrlF toxin-antitoxin module
VRSDNQGFIISVDERGRFLLPAKFRENLIRDQKFLLTMADDGSIILTPVSQVVESGLGLYKSKSPEGGFVEALLKDRRREFEQE